MNRHFMFETLDHYPDWQIEKLRPTHVNGLNERYVVRAGSMTGVGTTTDEAFANWQANLLARHV